MKPRKGDHPFFGQEGEIVQIDPAVGVEIGPEASFAEGGPGGITVGPEIDAAAIGERFVVRRDGGIAGIEAGAGLIVQAPPALPRFEEIGIGGDEATASGEEMIIIVAGIGK